MSEFTVHYAAQFAAEGGPGATLPRTSRPLLADITSGAIGIAFDHTRLVWVVTDADGQVFAEATNPGHLAAWFEEYLDALGAMHQRGEI